jgi:molybdopterin/thiamine biosynthesis adenylyltransferase
MTWDRVERLLGSDSLKLLAGKTVGIIGLGSGGGFVAQSLAMSGVGHLVLIDDDVVDEANIVRHVADRRYVGQSKVSVTADLVRQRNPAIQVDVREGRVEQHMDALDDLDVVAVCVDGEQTKYIINEACLDRNLTAVYAGVYERGEGGDVVIIRPFSGPCYACWSAELREGAELIENEGELDYGMIGPEGTLEAEPGLWLHVVRVAAVQAEFVLSELLKGTDVYRPYPANTVVLANAAIEIIAGEITPPHSSIWVQIERDGDCLVCGKRIRAEDEQQDFSLEDLASETGIQVESDQEA